MEKINHKKQKIDYTRKISEFSDAELRELLDQPNNIRQAFLKYYGFRGLIRVKLASPQIGCTEIKRGTKYEVHTCDECVFIDDVCTKKEVLNERLKILIGIYGERVNREDQILEV